MPSAAGKASRARPHNPGAQSHIKARHAASPVHHHADPSAQTPRPSLLEPTPTSLQQALLNSFTLAFPAELDPTTYESVLQPLLQEVKHHLYERDFGTAFSRPEWLRAYAARWSASRALGYVDIFRDILPLLLSTTKLSPPQTLTITCLGGGAGAEVAALAGWLAHSCATKTGPPPSRLRVAAFDMADWSVLLRDLRNALSSVPELAPATDENLSAQSVTADVLDPQLFAPDKPATSSIASSQLVTLMFTLNELYSTSISKAQKFLLDLTRNMLAGSLLLVVDSPGSYSTVRLGGSGPSADNGRATDSQKQRKYPMSWLLDHTLLETARDVECEIKGRQAEGPWEKLEAVESRWFRLGEGLRYPVQLENMRYQLHLYRRLAG